MHKSSFIEERDIVILAKQEYGIMKRGMTPA